MHQHLKCPAEDQEDQVPESRLRLGEGPLPPDMGSGLEKVRQSSETQVVARDRIQHQCRGFSRVLPFSHHPFSTAPSGPLGWPVSRTWGTPPTTCRPYAEAGRGNHRPPLAATCKNPQARAMGLWGETWVATRPAIPGAGDMSRPRHRAIAFYQTSTRRQWLGCR